jgi:arsenite methyltransferase
MTTRSAQELRAAVQDHYAQAARQASGCCSAGATVIDLFGRSAYTDAEAQLLPQAALAASLGCGNPTALAELAPGEVVLDLGSGGGLDVLLSARRVGPEGKAYGLDMTPEMHDLARRNQTEAGISNAEFLLGTIESIPLQPGSVDVIISNCVVNLAADKAAVLRESFRVLRPGGRLAISDIVLSRPLPAPIGELVALWTGCVAGALTEAACRRQLSAAGFDDVAVEVTRALHRADLQAMVDNVESGTLPGDLDMAATLDELDGVVRTAFIRARKPR